MGQRCRNHAEFPDELFSGLYEAILGLNNGGVPSRPLLFLRPLETTEIYFSLVTEKINAVNSYNVYYLIAFLSDWLNSDSGLCSLHLRRTK